MTKYRTTGHDVLPEQVKPVPLDPGQVGEGRIGVYDGAGKLRGQVGPKATSATASRFHGQLGSKLGTKEGKPAWLAPSRNSNTRPKSTGPSLAQIAALGSASPGSKANTLAGRSSRGATATVIKGGNNG